MCLRKITIVSIVGARPNFIKLAAVANLFDERFNHVVIHTGQHYDYELSKVFFDKLELRSPDIYLGVGSGTYGYQVGEMIKKIEKHLYSIYPDLVVVYGDTNSTLAGALAAVKAGFPVAHVEAGLRSHDIRMQEEINRRVVDHISSLLFAPTPSAKDNLKKESTVGKIFLTGDVHVDVLYRWLPKARESDILERLNLINETYIVATVHRAENVDNRARLLSILKGLKELSKRSKVVLPMHPRTKRRIHEYRLESAVYNDPNIVITKPLNYLDFIKLLMNSELVVTDSGGVQREAYLLKKPVIVLRDRTEWIELVNIGWVRLVDNDVNKLVQEYYSLIRDKPIYKPGVLGDGKAAVRIVSILSREVNTFE